MFDSDHDVIVDKVCDVRHELVLVFPEEIKSLF